MQKTFILSLCVVGLRLDSFSSMCLLGVVYRVAQLSEHDDVCGFLFLLPSLPATFSVLFRWRMHGLFVWTPTVTTE